MSSAPPNPDKSILFILYSVHHWGTTYQVLLNKGLLQSMLQCCLNASSDQWRAPCRTRARPPEAAWGGMVSRTLLKETKHSNKRRGKTTKYKRYNARRSLNKENNKLKALNTERVITHLQIMAFTSLTFLGLICLYVWPVHDRHINVFNLKLQNLKTHTHLNLNNM